MPADGVKGKTWGPSTAGGATKVRPNIVDESGQNRFSKSASSLEKSRALSIAPSITSVPESGKFCKFIRENMYNFVFYEEPIMFKLLI